VLIKGLINCFVRKCQFNELQKPQATITVEISSSRSKHMTRTNFVKAFSRFSIDFCRKQSRVRDDPMSFVPPMYTK